MSLFWDLRQLRYLKSITLLLLCGARSWSWWSLRIFSNPGYSMTLLMWENCPVWKGLTAVPRGEQWFGGVRERLWIHESSCSWTDPHLVWLSTDRDLWITSRFLPKLPVRWNWGSALWPAPLPVPPLPRQRAISRSALQISNSPNCKIPTLQQELGSPGWSCGHWDLEVWESGWVWWVAAAAFPRAEETLGEQNHLPPAKQEQENLSTHSLGF